ncbi:choice-of-anchor D domain-containing protein [Jiulongibacter sediminis]|uniref:Uncharacterized protein n=1 Tax=Jiulongibacter sediminis TaxID=1605367 RepID=A0A0P7CAR7_9BACT|nr:choice-of-anchor D domain-containing protein [Jiulongibacter sediminis]KPM49784.1 hypothetical protein AFM12_04210 [Jiulongibacter sediminis]TBX26822.1 hypothetical protein TK44_04215 [Jiulongibacter sediminis]
MSASSIASKNAFRSLISKICSLRFTILILSYFFFTAGSLQAQNDPFITRWDLSLSGSSSTGLSFGVQTSGSANYTWQQVGGSGATGSGTFSGTTLSITGLPANGIIDLSISPTNFQRINMGFSGDAGRLTQIKQWGDVVWVSMADAFSGCWNMALTATDVPNLASVTNMSYMFAYCSSFNQALPEGFNTSTVTNMESMFIDCNNYNKALPSSFNTAAVTNMNSMFFNCWSFNQNLASLTFNPSVTFGQFIDLTVLSVANYDALLTAFNSQNLTGKYFSTSSTNYCNAGDVRANLINVKGWTIDDAGLSPGCPTLPNLVVTGTLNAFSTCTGSASTEQSFTISGTNLSANVTITAPTGFEISTSSGTGFGTSVSLTQSGGSVSSTTIYVRMAANATGTPSGNITCSTSGATDQTVAVSGTVNALPTVTFSSTLSQIDMDAGVQTGISGGSPTGVIQSTTDDILIDNVSFADGGVATGHIDFDVFQGNSSTTSSDFSVSVSGGNTTNFPSITYDQTNATATLTGGPNIITIIHTATNRRLYLPVTFNMISGQSLGTRHLHPTAKEDFNGTAPSRVATGSFTFGQYYATTGVYSGSGLTDRGGSFFFDPATAGLGTHTITYTFENANGCINSATDEIEVIPSCDIAITSATPTAETCPGGNDGQISVVATCTTCTSIEYSTDDFVTAANTTGTFTGLADGTYTVKVRDSGDAGCNATASNVIVVAGVDNTPPTISCQPFTLVLDVGGNGTLTVNDVLASSSDACGIATSTLSKTAFTSADIGTNNVTVTVTDVNGNPSNCVAVVTVTAAAPSLSSTGSPFTFSVGTPITPITISNTGGIVPGVLASSEATVSTFRSAADPFAVAADSDNNVYYTYKANGVSIIYKIDPNGIRTTFAGGSAGYADGTGSSARFYNPNGIGTDAIGNVYVADASNHKIRKITPFGVVTTLAGSTQGFADGVGNAAQFSGPQDVAADNMGNVYVIDNGNYKIRKISPSGEVSTLVGSIQGHADGVGSAAKFSDMRGLTIDASGNLYVAEFGTSRIRKISPAGSVSTIAGSSYGYADGIGTSAKFNVPTGLEVDGSGNIYVVDVNNSKIRKITPSGVVTTIAGSTSGYSEGPGSTAQFNSPWDLAIDSDQNIYVSDRLNHKIRKIEPADPNGFALSISLPSGLTFEPSTATISGTPTTPSVAADYTVTGTNSGGSSSVILNMTVVGIPEINVKGNGQDIAEGDTTPDVNDDTDFGDQDIASGSVVKTFTIENNGSADLALSGNPIVALSGSGAFTVSTQPSSTSISPAGNLTFQITFDPSTAGIANATVSIANDDADENPYTFDITGNGIIVCDIAITSATPTAETCPGANDGTITVVATCTTCTSIEYSIDDFATAANTSGTFTGLADGTYTVKVRDSGDANCNDTQSNVVVAAGVDNTAPVAVCPAVQDTLYLDAVGTATLAANSLGDGSSTDNCGTVTETNPLVSFTCANLGANTLVLTADDGNGNTDAVNCTVIVLDTISPVITCPVDITVESGTSLGINAIANYPLANDLIDQTGNNSPVTLTSYSGSTISIPSGGQLCLNGEVYEEMSAQVPGIDFNNVAVKVDFNASQFAPSFRNSGAVLTFGQSYRWLGIHIRKADGRIGILYNNNNVLYSNVDLNLNQWYTAELSYTNGVAELKLDGVLIQTENLPALVNGNNKNIFSGDAGGGRFIGCLRNVIVGSIGAPVPVCEAKVELPDPTVTDNCLSTVTTTNDAPASFPLGSTTVTWTSTDASGNTANCTQVVTVIYPEINVQGNSTDIVNGDITPNTTDATDFGNTDTATPVEMTYTIQNLGTDTLELSQNNQVTISGDSEFTILTQPSSSAILSGGSDLTFVVKYTPTTAGNHSAIVSISNNDCDETTYTFTVSGSAVLACDITITSATPTDETCPGANDGEINVVATCNTCTSIEYSIDDFATTANTTGSFTGLSDGIYTLKVRDSGDAGCIATQSNVTVAAGVDNIPPILVGCPATASFTLDLCNEITINADSLGITATDNCGTPTITLSQYSFSSAGSYDVTVTATDGASLTSTCLVSVTIEENPNFFTISLTDDNINACVDGSFTFTAASLLANDNTSNSSTLEVQEVTLTNPADGTLTNDGNGNFTFTPANGVIGNVALTYLAKVAGEDLYFEPNGHYYEFIAADGISWTDAKAAAEARTLFGQTGYLATITSAEENGFVYSKLQGEGWLGGQEIGGVNSGDWRWVTGPEALEDNGNGLKFWDGNVGGVAIPGVYQNWISGEPNNWNNNESYLHMRTSGQWNDFPLLSYTNQADRINGYVVEYGGIACTPNFTAIANITINVQMKPSIADITTQVNTCPSNVFDLGNLSITDDNSVPETITTFHGQKPTSATDLTNQLASLVITSDQKVYVMVANATTACYDVDSFMVDITLCVPEMDVFGNTVEIINGDNTPDAADDTDFGSHDVSAANVVKTFTIENNGTADLALSGNPIVTLSGSSDFSVSAQPAAASISPAGSLTFEITFNPTSAGTATATVSIANDDAEENPYTFDISGTVTCDLAVTSATPTDVNCPGADDGTITVLATCTTCTSIEYSIDDFATSNTTGVFSDLPDGTYTIKVRDSGDAGCTSSQTDVIVAPGIDHVAPVLSCPATKEIALNFCGETVLTTEMLDVTATDNCIANPIFSLSQTIFSGVGTSTVTVYATDGTNQSSCDVEVSFIEQTVSLTNNGPVCEGDSITFTATPMGSNLGYAFFKQQKGGSSPTTINSVSFYNSSNTYKTADIADSEIWLVLVTDGSGCTVYDTNLVRVNPLPTVSLTLNPTQFSLYDGIQTGLSGGSPAAGGATLDNININNVTLAGGGTATGYVRFNSFVSGQTSPDFSVSVSGGNTTDFPPLTYNQANSTATISGGPNIISIVSTTSNRRLYIQFSQNIQPGVTVTRNLQGNSKEDHNGALPSRAASGSVSTAPYTQNNGIYSGAGVTDQGGTFDFDPSVAGEGVHVISYTYTNASGCEATATTNLEVIIPPCGVDIDIATPTAESCTGENDGSITVTASCSPCSGGTSDIRYSLDSLDFSNTTAVFANLPPGTYSVYVRDVNYVQCTSSLKNIVVEAANDVTAPVLDCPVSTEVELDICDNVVLTAELLNVTATDNCVANPVLSLSQNNFNGTGTYNIDVFATDGVNQSQCTVEVTLVTNEAKLFLQAFDNPLGTYPFNTSVVISSAELLANDILINGINMQITGMVVDNPSHGTIVNNNNGTYTFTPNSTYSGPVSLTYAVSSDACTPAISATALATFDILPAPSNVEILDGIDNNGNGIIDEGLDCDPTLVAHWTFEPGNELTDLTGNFPDLTLNGATVSNGKLDVGIQQYATTSNFAGPSLINKTLVAWVSLDQLNNSSIGGSALTIDKVNVDRFDGIGFSEGGLNKWQLASNYYKRTQSLTPGFSETTPNQMVRIVITYQAGITNQAFVRMYRDNVLIGEYIKGTMETFDTGANTEIFFGLRHQFPGGRLPGKPWLDAKIEEARIYDGCMTFAEIQTLSPVISGANLTVTPSDTLVCPGESVTLTVSGCTTGTATWSYSSTSNTGTSITVVPSVTTTYQVNCSSGGSAQKTISVVENTVAVANNIDTGTETVKAVQTITSDKKVGSTSVSPKPNVNFRAGHSITLDPGFETVSSVVFKAEIKTCTE